MQGHLDRNRRARNLLPNEHCLSSIILGLLINGLLVGIYFASRSINPLLIGLILDALFGGYVFLTKDYSRGEFIGIVGDTLYIRTVGGRESMVRNEKIDRIRTYNLPSYTLLLLNGGKISIPAYSIAFDPAYKWFGQNLECPNDIVFGMKK